MRMSDVESHIASMIAAWASQVDTEMLGQCLVTPGSVRQSTSLAEFVPIPDAGAKVTPLMAFADPVGMRTRLLDPAKNYAAGSAGLPLSERPAQSPGLPAAPPSEPCGATAGEGGPHPLFAPPADRRRSFSPGIAEAGFLGAYFRGFPAGSSPKILSKLFGLVLIAALPIPDFRLHGQANRHAFRGREVLLRPFVAA